MMPNNQPTTSRHPNAIKTMKHPAKKTTTAKKHITIMSPYLPSPPSSETKRGVSIPHLAFHPLGKIPESNPTHIPTPLPHATYLRGEGTQPMETDHYGTGITYST